MGRRKRQTGIEQVDDEPDSIEEEGVLERDNEGAMEGEELEDEETGDDPTLAPRSTSRDLSTRWRAGPS